MVKSVLLVIFLTGLLLDIAQATCNPSDQYRTLDGSCNNLVVPALGSSGQYYRRGVEGAEYQPDGSPVDNRPLERVISNKISRDDPADVDEIPHSMFATQFGQFVNHDLNNNAFDDPDSIVYTDVLVVPELDDSFCWVMADPAALNFTLVNRCLPPYNEVPLFTTKFSTVDVVANTPQVVNDATAWLDLHHVYGVNPTVASALRTHVGGKLLTNDYIDFTTSPSQIFGFFQFGFGPTAPYSCIGCLPSWNQTGGVVSVNPLMDPTLPNAFGYSGTKIFVAGDERVGENAALSMFQLLFLRNHNRHAAALAAANPTWDDETLYQRARRINIAEYQNIVLYQYVPTEFGEYFAGKLGHYHYDAYEDADVNVAFATAAFRYGHSSFRNYVPLDDCGVAKLFNQPAGDTPLFLGGQTGGPVLPMDVYGEIGSWENLIRGLIAKRTAPNDVEIDAALRDLPFGFPIPGGTDVWTLDLHRARENGVPNYAVLQKEYGKGFDQIYGSPGCPAVLFRRTQDDPVACFNNLTPYNLTLAANMHALYGKVKRVDPLVGLLAEVHRPGTSFGETLGTIIMDTYKRARNGDRFWFENTEQPMPFSSSEIDDIRDVGIDDLLTLNFDLPVNQVPANPFLSPAEYIANLAGQSSC